MTDRWKRRPVEYGPNNRREAEPLTRFVRVPERVLKALHEDVCRVSALARTQLPEDELAFELLDDIEKTIQGFLIDD